MESTKPSVMTDGNKAGLDRVRRILSYMYLYIIIIIFIITIIIIIVVVIIGVVIIIIIISIITIITIIRCARRKAATHFSWRLPRLSTTCSSIVTSGSFHSRLWSFHNVYGHSTTRQLGGLLDSKGYGIALPKGNNIIYCQITLSSKIGIRLKTILARLAVHSCHLCRGVEASGAGHPEEAEEEVVSNYNFWNATSAIRVSIGLQSNNTQPRPTQVGKEARGSVRGSNCKRERADGPWQARWRLHCRRAWHGQSPPYPYQCQKCIQLVIIYIC